MIFKRLQISFIFFQQSVKKLQIDTNYPFLLYKLSLIPLISKAINFKWFWGQIARITIWKITFFIHFLTQNHKLWALFLIKRTFFFQQHLIFYVQSAVTFSKNSSLFSVKTFGPSKNENVEAKIITNWQWVITEQQQQ